MLENTEEIELVGLLNKIKEMKTDGSRIVQICATKIGGNYELLYTFGVDYDIKHVKVTVGPDAHVPSITDIFPAAYLYENEIHDLFGIAVDGINHDYKGRMYRTPVEAPFR